MTYYEYDDYLQLSSELREEQLMASYLDWHEVQSCFVTGDIAGEVPNFVNATASFLVTLQMSVLNVLGFAVVCQVLVHV